MTSTEDERLAELFGKQAAHSEHSRGERIRYRLPGEGSHEGIILWCASESEIDGRRIHQHYIVERDAFSTLTRVEVGDSFPDIVFPVDVLQ